MVAIARGDDRSRRKAAIREDGAENNRGQGRVPDAPASRLYLTTSASRITASLGSRSFLRQPRLSEAVEHGRKVRRVFLYPFDRDFGIEAAGFG